MRDPAFFTGAMESGLTETPRLDDEAPTPAPAIPAVMLWSGGKDSMLALHRVLSEGGYKIESLVTTVTSGYNRISMHGVRLENLHAQAESLGLPLTIARISPGSSNGQYEDAMILCLVQFAAKGIKHVICGDLFLADIREYRERLFKRVGMQGVYPLWQHDTRKLADEFIGTGYKAALCCVNPRVVPDTIAGRDFDDALLAELPESCDPCGENGEFHSFVYDGPLFKTPVKIVRGQTVVRDGFAFTDLIPAD
jgi:uncharacterized protein (TIGR00290 family)